MPDFNVEIDVDLKGRRKPLPIANKPGQAGRKGDGPPKRDRSAFLYFGPQSPTKRHGQCSTCRLYNGEESGTCSVLGKSTDVGPTYSCGLYVHGRPEAQDTERVYNAKQVGLIDGPVRCENCDSYNSGDGTCMFFEDLNKKLGSTFALDIEVHTRGCCNAFTPRPKEDDE